MGDRQNLDPVTLGETLVLPDGKTIDISDGMGGDSNPSKIPAGNHSALSVESGA